jgi:hypothetical protein
VLGELGSSSLAAGTSDSARRVASMNARSCALTTGQRPIVTLLQGNDALLAAPTAYRPAGDSTDESSTGTFRVGGRAAISRVPPVVVVVS